jgi:hypothetical protein
VSSLYRCRARVAYRPYGSDKLIVFEERQIQELSVKLKWQPNLAFSNADQATPASVYTNALSQSTCSVTVSDPYLTGLAWPALFDAAALYTAATHAAANNILLPACKEGQDPNVDKCFQFVDLEANSVGESGAETSGTAKFAHLILSLWYDVKGTSFGTDFYFRVDGISISHGTKYPSVTLRGVEARSVLFNQSLVNMSFEEGMTVEDAVKELAEKQGYEASFCANANEEGGSPRTNVLNRSIRLKGATPDEILKKLVNATGGNTLTQPVREYANKISICTRGEVNQGCTVFYLGKGLYEGYEITGQPDISLLNQNMESGGSFNNADPYVSQSFAANTYIIDDITPNKRKAALEKVKKLAFPQLFTSCAPRCQGWPTSSGYVWKGAGPGAINEKVKDTVLYGIAPNGTTSISFLKGVVEEASADTGKIVIKTDFFLRMCEDTARKKCFSRPILQESSNLTTVSVKTKDKVEISKEIGKSTAEKKEFVRFYIKGHNNEFVVLDPQLVWKYAVPVEELKDVEKPAPQGSATSGGAAQPPAAAQPGAVIGRVGSTGSSSGPHLHAQWSDGRSITAEQVREFVKVPGVVTSPYNDPSRSRHLGVDIGGNNGAPIELINGASVASVNETKCTVQNSRNDGCGGGFGNNVTISTPKGNMILAHLAPESIPPNIAGLSSSSGAGKTQGNIQSAGGTKGAVVETGFKGVPRALRIIPGRTILSFVTEYDEWIEGGRQPNAPDPGVWIPKRFKNWFINECEYKWRDGDLRIQIEGVSQWGTGMTQVPLFSKYMESMKAAGEIKVSSSYYDYIRSLGTLAWKTDDGKDSTEVHCKEAQEFAKFLSEGTESQGAGSGATDVTGSYPTANCQNSSSPAQNAIMGALRSAGINTKNAYAGVLGNLQEESGFNPNVHNTSIQGFTCLSTSGAREKCYGLAQWGGSRKVDILRKCGQTSTLQCQLEFMTQEIAARGGGMVQKLNNAKSPGEAAVIWARDYEVSDISYDSRRARYADTISGQLKCDR